MANVWLVFAKDFIVADKPGGGARATIAADSKYWLWVNGRLVVREGGLKWGPTPTTYYEDTIDLAPYLLAKAENRIEALVWHFGKDGFSHKNSGQAGFYLDAPALGIATDASWRAGTHEAFRRKSPPPRPNYRLPEANVVFDARLAGPLIQRDEPLFAYRGEWAAAVPFVRPQAGEIRPIPQWKDFGLKTYANAPALPWRSNGDTLRLRLPYNAQVTAQLVVTAPALASSSGKMAPAAAPSKASPTESGLANASPAAAPKSTAEVLPIDIRTDHYRGGGPPNVRTLFYPRPGERQTFESPGWFNGHHVEYAVPAGYVVHELHYRETGYASAFAGSFDCDDDFYNDLWTKAQRTLYVTMRDSYMDCPDRERAQWWGDVVLEAGETSYALDRRSDLLTRKAIRELMRWQRPDSTIYSPVPAGNWDGELPTQMLASVGRYGIWNYYFHTGDRALIEEVYPAVKRYLAVWQTDADGLVIPRKGGWTWGDWGKNKDLPLLFNGWYYLALDGQARMADVLGKRTDAEAARDRMARLRVAFNDRYWRGDAYRSDDRLDITDDRGQALAVVAGIAPSAYYPRIKAVLNMVREASPYFEKYVEEALFRMGYPDLALARMKDRFGPMVTSDLTTLWEGWEIGSATYGGGTTNHAWSGGGLTLLSEFVVGIQPVTAGYGKVRIRPQLGPLKRARATVATPLGELKVWVAREFGSVKIRYEAPEEMEILE